MRSRRFFGGSGSKSRVDDKKRRHTPPVKTSQDTPALDSSAAPEDAPSDAPIDAPIDETLIEVVVDVNDVNEVVTAIRLGIFIKLII